MKEPKDMTDDELVEAVAKEVMGWGKVMQDPPGNIIHEVDKENCFDCNFPEDCTVWKAFDPITDANDRDLVMGKYENWTVERWGSAHIVTIRTYKKLCNQEYTAESVSFARACLEAALKTVRSEG